MSKQTFGETLALLLGSFAIAATFVVIVALGQADASQPFGGCAEAWQAPRSAGAQDCRDNGWTVTPKYVVSPRQVMRMQDLDPCRHEDGSGQGACGWNINARGVETGNGRGLAYIHTREDFIIQLRVCVKDQCRDARARDFR